MGYLFPNTLRISFIIGLLWEFFEWYCGVYKPKSLKLMFLCIAKWFKKKERKRIMVLEMARSNSKLN